MLAWGGRCPPSLLWVLPRVPSNSAIDNRVRTCHASLFQGVVAHQDSLLELQLHEAGERRERLSRTNSRKEAPAPPAATSPSADWQATDLSLLQKQHSLLQEELSRCRQLCQEKAQEAAVLEARLRESEQERVRQEQLAEEARKQLAAQRQTGEAWARKNAEPRRRSLPAGDALYQSFTPPQVTLSPVWFCQKRHPFRHVHTFNLSSLSPP